MAQRRYYRVAGHLFSVTAEEFVFAQMSNYQPFETEETTDETVFDLTVGDVDLSEEKTHVFTDTSDDDMPRIEIYRIGQDRLFQVSITKHSEICLSLRASEDFRKASLCFATNDIRFSIDNACMLLYAFSTADKHTLEMHAAVIERKGHGFLFLGHSGTGKSTHARMWMSAFEDAKLLNDDNPVLRILENGEVHVYGSPWSGKTPCYINREVPVGAIVQLAQAPHNKIWPLRLPEAYAYMLSSASGLKIEPKMMDALYDTIARVIQTVQVYKMECLPDTDAARVCEKEITIIQLI